MRIGLHSRYARCSFWYQSTQLSEYLTPYFEISDLQVEEGDSGTVLYAGVFDGHGAPIFIHVTD